MYATPDQSAAWLKSRMGELDIANLDELADLAATDKGNLSRIFRQLQSPRVDALEPLASALQVSVYELLVRIGAVDPYRADVPSGARLNGSKTFTWPKVASR
jgi:transcriptional regulator with XRE-family HTH domain